VEAEKQRRGDAYSVPFIKKVIKAPLTET